LFIFLVCRRFTPSASFGSQRFRGLLVAAFASLRCEAKPLQSDYAKPKQP
jgi:hypothetical protein